MRIDSSGRVGIGTGTINRKLVINEASAESVVQITNGTSGVGADDGFQIIHFTSGATQLINRENGSLSLHTNNTTALTIDSSQNATFAGKVIDVYGGDVRRAIQTTKSSAHTLVATDQGKHIHISSGGVTVPNNVLTDGDMVTIVNNSGSAQTITQGTGVTMYNPADATTGNRTLAGRGVCTILFTSASVCYISGAGLS